MYLRKQLSAEYDSCQERVAQVLTNLLQRRVQDGHGLFDAEQNAHVVVDAERYYRSMYYATASSWNLRDRHMADTLDRVLEHRGPQAKAVVWAHNSHVGDARETEMGWRRGELNIGQLVRERYGEAAALIGFATGTGTVAAADDWHGEMEVKQVNPPIQGSIEAAADASGLPRFLLDISRLGLEARTALNDPLLQRAIGVIYRPGSERAAHYFEARMARQFDAWVWVAETEAVHARHAHPAEGEDDLVPFGL
jgi:erythromycin esterase-like protein